MVFDITGTAVITTIVTGIIVTIIIFLLILFDSIPCIFNHNLQILFQRIRILTFILYRNTSIITKINLIYG